MAREIETMSVQQLQALRHMRTMNDCGMGAIMPHAELIRAADETVALGLSEDRGHDRRWLTDAGRAALAAAPDHGGRGE